MRMQRFFILLFRWVLASFCDCELARWQPQLQPTCLQVQVWIWGQTLEPTYTLQKRLIGSDLPPLSYVPTPEPVTDHRGNWCSGSDAKPGSYTVPGMGVVGGPAKATKTTGDGGGEGWFPTTMGGRYWKQSEWKRADQEATHVHHEGLGSHICNSVRSSPGPECGCGKLHLLDCPPDGIWIGLRDEGILLLLRMTKLTPSTAPGERLSLLANPSSFSFLWEDAHSAVHTTPPLASPLCSLPSMSLFTSFCSQAPPLIHVSLLLWPPLSPVCSSLLPLSVSLSIAAWLPLSLCLPPPVCLALSELLSVSVHSLSLGFCLSVSHSLFLILSVLHLYLSTFLSLSLPFHFIFCVYFPFSSAFVWGLSYFLNSSHFSQQNSKMPTSHVYSIRFLANGEFVRMEERPWRKGNSERKRKHWWDTWGITLWIRGYSSQNIHSTLTH